MSITRVYVVKRTTVSYGVSDYWGSQEYAPYARERDRKDEIVYVKRNMNDANKAIEWDMRKQVKYLGAACKVDTLHKPETGYAEVFLTDGIHKYHPLVIYNVTMYHVT